MNCEQARANYTAWRDGELSPPERRLLEAHLAVCAECRRVFAELDVLQQVMHSIPEAKAPDSLRTQVKARLKTAPTPAPRPWQLLTFWRLGLAASFLLVVVVFGWWFFYGEDFSTTAARTPELALPSTHLGSAPPAAPPEAEQFAERAPAQQPSAGGAGAPSPAPAWQQPRVEKRIPKGAEAGNRLPRPGGEGSQARPQPAAAQHELQKPEKAQPVFDFTLAKRVAFAPAAKVRALSAPRMDSTAPESESHRSGRGEFAGAAPQPPADKAVAMKVQPLPEAPGMSAQSTAPAPAEPAPAASQLSQQVLEGAFGYVLLANTTQLHAGASLVLPEAPDCRLAVQLLAGQGMQPLLTIPAVAPGAPRADRPFSAEAVTTIPLADKSVAYTFSITCNYVTRLQQLGVILTPETPGCVNMRAHNASAKVLLQLLQPLLPDKLKSQCTPELLDEARTRVLNGEAFEVAPAALFERIKHDLAPKQ